MYCNQCEQTAKGGACTKVGVCGKDPDVAALQDLLIHVLQGISLYANEGRKTGVTSPKADMFTVKGIFATLTNVDFDPGRFSSWIRQGVAIREELKDKIAGGGGRTDFDHPAAAFAPSETRSWTLTMSPGAKSSSLSARYSFSTARKISSIISS